MKTTILAVSVLLAAVAQPSPSPLRTPYKTERAWALSQITADIQEMAGRKATAAESEFAALTPWNPNDAMVAFAAAQLGRGSGAGETLRDQYPLLVQPTAATLFAASQDISKALKRNIRNARAHEAAAIVLGAFGLLEAADDFSDHRWAMNRMTAHLAVASALRGPGAAMSTDGQLASATLAALSQRQGAALDMIARMGDPQADAAKAAWLRALTMRVTQDWRLAKDPAAATRLEKLEYVRARRATVADRRAGLELDDLNVHDDADFARVVQPSSHTVEDGNEFIAGSVARELSELAALHQRAFTRTMPTPLPDVVNERAGRLMGADGPTVLPWGAWAEFSQRHIAMAVADTDRHFRRTLAMPDKADSLNTAMDGVLKTLRMFSIASTSRRIGSKATEADLRYFREALDVLSAAPEVVTVSYWKFFETAAGHERLPARVPGHRSWFIDPSREVPYDVSLRSRDPNLIPLAVHEGLVDAAPHNVWVLWTANARQPRDQALYERANALIRNRVGYDLWAIDREVDRAANRDGWEKPLRRGCELSPRRCLTLASRLISTDEQAAAAEYERALNNPALDRVLAANNSEWLVFYYERNNEPARARVLAERAAKAYSYYGLQTLARLLERRGESQEAGKLFEAIYERYPHRVSALAGFLYRRSIVHRDARFTARWEEIRSRLFPTGLTPETTSASQPGAGVFVEQDSAESRRVRLQTGDIIVGVDGWRVDNLDQFNAVMAFGDQLNTHKITAWRGVLFTASVPTSHGMTLNNHPLKGWVQ